MATLSHPETFFAHFGHILDHIRSFLAVFAFLVVLAFLAFWYFLKWQPCPTCLNIWKLKFFRIFDGCMQWKSIKNLYTCFFYIQVKKRLPHLYLLIDYKEFQSSIYHVRNSQKWRKCIKNNNFSYFWWLYAIKVNQKLIHRLRLYLSKKRIPHIALWIDSKNPNRTFLALKIGKNCLNIWKFKFFRIFDGCMQ